MFVYRRGGAHLEPQENFGCKSVCKELCQEACGAVALTVLGSGMGIAAVSILSLLGPKISWTNGALYGAFSYYMREHSIKLLEGSCVLRRNIAEMPLEDASNFNFRFECGKAIIVAIGVGLIAGEAFVNFNSPGSLTIPVAAMITGMELAMTYVVVGGSRISGFTSCSLSFGASRPAQAEVSQALEVEMVAQEQAV